MEDRDNAVHRLERASRGGELTGAREVLLELEVALTELSGGNLLLGVLGHSSPIVWDDRVFVTTAVSSDPQSPFEHGEPDTTAVQHRSQHSWRVYAVDLRVRARMGSYFCPGPKHWG